MKKILLSTVALAGFTAGAVAADLPARRVAPVAPFVAAVPVFTWTGFYVGVNAGYGFSDNDRDNFNDTVVIPAPPAGAPATFTGGNGGRRNNETDGFVGGGQIGYNYQFTPGAGFVVGIEADIQYVDFGRGRNSFFGNGNQVVTVVPGLDVAPVQPGAGGNVLLTNNFDNARSLDYFGTVRARLGYAFDRMMIYATGGFAYGGGDAGDFGYGQFAAPTNFFVNGAAAARAGSGTGVFGRNGDDTRTGWTVGGGLEYAFTNNITAKIEGLYVNLGDDNNNRGNARLVAVTNTGAQVFNTNNEGRRNNDTEFAVIRAGLNFKFNTF